MWLCRFAQASAATVLTGTAALRLLAWDSAGLSGAEPRWNRLAVASWGTLFLAAICQLGLTAAQMSDLPLTQALERYTLASVVTDTHSFRRGLAGAARAARGRAFDWVGRSGFPPARQTEVEPSPRCRRSTARYRASCQSGGRRPRAGIGEAWVALAGGHAPRECGWRMAGRIAPAGHPAHPRTPEPPLAHPCDHGHPAVLASERGGGRRAGDERIAQRLRSDRDIRSALDECLRSDGARQGGAFFDDGCLGSHEQAAHRRSASRECTRRPSVACGATSPSSALSPWGCSWSRRLWR